MTTRDAPRPARFSEEFPLGVSVRRKDEGIVLRQPAEHDLHYDTGIVVLEMPDFVADVIAHLLHACRDITELLGFRDPSGPPRRLADLLRQAVLAQPHYQCTGSSNCSIRRPPKRTRVDRPVQQHRRPEPDSRDPGEEVQR
jgi:hypothetical protein